MQFCGPFPLEILTVTMECNRLRRNSLKTYPFRVSLRKSDIYWKAAKARGNAFQRCGCKAVSRPAHFASVVQFVPILILIYEKGRNFCFHFEIIFRFILWKQVNIDCLTVIRQYVQNASLHRRKLIRMSCATCNKWHV